MELYNQWNILKVHYKELVGQHMDLREELWLKEIEIRELQKEIKSLEGNLCKCE